MRLGAHEVAVEAPGDERLLAWTVANALPDVALVLPRGADESFTWSGAVLRGTEAWPIHYLMPGGGALR